MTQQAVTQQAVTQQAVTQQAVTQQTVTQQTVAAPELRPPGVCLSWDEFRKRYPTILGNEQQIREIWERNDAEAYFYFWQCLLSF